MLELSNVEVTYEPYLVVVRGLSLHVPEGRIVTLLGPNGAGKSTTLKAVSGLVKAERGRVTKGNIEFTKQRIDNLDPERIARMGITHVMEGRRVFRELTVQENLKVGLSSGDEDLAYSFFPPLASLKKMKAGYLSGGEQQMLVIGRALLTRPRLMLLDEPSLGLAPMVANELFKTIKRINEEERVTILLVEQNAVAALGIADHGYVMENGRIVLEGGAGELMNNKDIREFFLGLGEAGRRSYREVKAYRRRKRWLS